MYRGEEVSIDADITKGISKLSINQESKSRETKQEGKSNGDANSLKAKFNQFVLDAKDKARQGLLEEALELFNKAYKIHQSEKLLKRINKLKEFIKEYAKEEENEEEEEEEDDDGMIEIGNGFSLAKEISEALYPYQKEGVLWFWRLYQQKQGGILGDDMGLGKTIQVIAFLSGMFDNELIKSVLIVMPVSLISNWEKEFQTWTPGIRVKSFHGSNKKERQRNLDKIQRKNGVCLTTYGLIVSSHEVLSSTVDGRRFKWDYVILDEGHKIKNPTKTSKNIRSIPARNHFILTGTPIQNNLREMWSLFDYVTQGQLLGSSRTFKQEFENPIVRARERDASAYEKRIGGEMAKSLRKLIDPHFLRRTKAMVLKSKDSTPDKEDGGNATQGEFSLLKTPSATFPEKLTRKNDFIIWLHLSDTQIQIYKDFLGLERVKEILMDTRSPLAELNVLKKICDHPRLLSAMACSQLGLDDNARVIDLEENKENEGSDIERSLATKYNDGRLGVSDSALIQESGKMLFMVALLDNLKKEGHRCLIFSQSRKMLDMVHRIITHRGHKVLRIDGTVTKTADRQHLVDTFQNNPSYTCCLLTTQVGGVGLTLTAADRVVIFDPSWNPATDAQAVDRAYRIGQTKPVVIYRLITCGTIEEKIYRKQIFKDALMKQTTGSSVNPFRYFTREDLRELFTLDDPLKSKTQLQLSKMHSHHRESDQELDKHVDFLHSLNIFGITDHDLMYTQEAVETAEEMEQANCDAIQARVLRAQSMVAAESSAGSQPLPSVLPAPYQNPKSLLKPINVEDLVNKEDKKTIQAKIHQFEVFKPTREDTKRFMPRDKKPIKPQAPKPNDVVDLCTPPVSPGEQAVQSNDYSPRSNTTSHQTDVDEDMANLSIQDEKSISSNDIESDDSPQGSSKNSPIILDSSPPPQQNHASSSGLMTQTLDSPVPTSSRDSSSPVLPHDLPFSKPPFEPTLDTQIPNSPGVMPLQSDILSMQSNDSPALSCDSTSPTQVHDASPKQVSYSPAPIQAFGSMMDSEEINRGQSDSNVADDDSKNEMDQSDAYPRFSLDLGVNDSRESVNERNTQATDSNLRPSDMGDTDLSFRGVDDATCPDSYLASTTPAEPDMAQNTPVDDADMPVITSANATPSDDSYLAPTKLSYSNSPSTTPIGNADLLQTTSTGDADLVPTTPVNDANLTPTTEIQQSIENILFSSPAVYVPDDGKRQTPRRKSSKFRRKSMSQRPFHVIDDSDDDSENSNVAPTYVQQHQEEEKALESSSRSLDEDTEVFLTPNSTLPESKNSDKSASLNEEDIIGSFQEKMSSTMMLSQDNDDEDDDDDEGVVNITKAQRRIDSTDDEEDSAGSPEEEGGEAVFDTPSGSSPGMETESDVNHTDEDESPMKAKARRRVLRIESDDEEDVENEDEESDEEILSKENESEDSEEPSNSEVSSATSSQNQDESNSSTEGESDDKNRMQKRRVKRLESSDDDDDDESVSSGESRDGHDCSRGAKKPLSERGNQYCCPTGLHYFDDVKIQRCACVLNEDEKENYARYVRLANEEESQGKLAMALDYYLEALKIDSSDLRMHKRALELVKQQNLETELLKL